MKKALKRATHIFMSRSSWQLSVFILFAIAGHHEKNSIGELNLFISFTGVFATVASISLVYWQTEASNKKNSKSNVLSKGLQISMILSGLVSALSIILSKLTLTDPELLLAVQIVSITYPMLAIISFLTYYLEGVGKAHLPARSLFTACILQSFIFYMLLKTGIPMLFSIVLTFLVVDCAIAIYLLWRVSADLNNQWQRLNFTDIADLFRKGLPLSIGVGVQKYIYSLIILAISVFGSVEANMFAAITGLIFLLLLPQVGIANAAAISVSEHQAFDSDFRYYAVLTLGYVICVSLFVCIKLQSIIELFYNVRIPADKLNISIFSAIVFFVSQTAILFALSLARAFNIIKLPQVLTCLALLLAFIISQMIASDVFMFVNAVAYCQIICAIVVFLYVLKKTSVFFLP